MALVVVTMLVGCNTSDTATSDTTTSIPTIEKVSKGSYDKVKNEFKAQKIDPEIHQKFSDLFNNFSGFEFDDYFFIPKEDVGAKWIATEYEEYEGVWKFELMSSYIISHDNGEKLLKLLRERNDYMAYYNSEDWYNFDKANILGLISKKSRDNKEGCYYFLKEVLYPDTNVERSITIRFYSTGDKENTYFVELFVYLDNDPPYGEYLDKPLKNN